MKVVLLKDVKGIGRAHDEVDASDGHALNFLIPKRLAISATVPARKEAGLRRAQAAARGAVRQELVAERLAALAEGALVVKKKANAQGHLYDALDAQELAALATLPEEAVQIERPLKEVGVFEVPVVFGGAFGSFRVAIEAQ